MLFVSLAKFRKKPNKESIAQLDKAWKDVEAWGVKRIGTYWTLGRYDAVVIGEAPNEKTVMKTSLKFSEMAALETMVALLRDEAIKLVE